MKYCRWCKKICEQNFCSMEHRNIHDEWRTNFKLQLKKKTKISDAQKLKYEKLRSLLTEGRI